MLLHDVKLLFAEGIDNVELGPGAITARFATKLVLLGLEVTRDGLSPRGLRSLLRRAVLRRLLRRLRAFLERASLVAIDEGCGSHGTQSFPSFHSSKAGPERRNG